MNMRALGAFFALCCLWHQGVQAHPGHPLDDPSIFAIFDQANAVDISAGKLGVERGESDAVRQLASAIISLRSDLQARSRALVNERKIAVIDPNAPGQLGQYAENIKKLDASPKGAFDAAYLRHEINFQRTLIFAFKRSFMRAVEDPELSQLMEASLTQLEQQYKETVAVAERLGVE